MYFRWAFKNCLTDLNDFYYLSMVIKVDPRMVLGWSDSSDINGVNTVKHIISSLAYQNYIIIISGKIAMNVLRWYTDNYL